jgi:putative methionine-R-sulfoxide reductase with GAF domain
VTQTATSPQRKPVLDEASFQQLLAAAFALQDHNDRLRAKGSHSEFANNLSAIVETQKLIQTLQLDLTAAAALVAERSQKITNASGAAIGILEQGQLIYRAGTGTAKADTGNQVAPDSALSADCIRKGMSEQFADVATLAPEKAKLFRDRDVKAFIAVPVYHAGQVAGVLELRLAGAGAFREADVRTAELMAGLLSEAMVTAARMKWKQALASERQNMLEALERIKPQIERLGSETLAPEGHAVAAPPPAGTKAAVPAPRVVDTCSVCGSDFFDQTESFCGICGAARAVANATRGVESKTAAPRIVPYAEENSSNGKSLAAPAQPENADTLPGAMPASLQELIELCAAHEPAAGSGIGGPKENASLGSTSAPESHLVRVEHDPRPLSAAAPGLTSEAHPSPAQFEAPVEGQAAATKSEQLLRIVPTDLARPAESAPLYPWSSARKAQDWLETVKGRGPGARWLAYQWQRRRANIYIGIAALILVIVLSGWGIHPPATTSAANASPGVTGQPQRPPEPQLTPLERLLVSLGLAEAPPAPVYMGNPDTQVWVDVHTALYHCPGSEAYGKTPDGRFTTQRDAQQDQFEPANRKACP